MAQIKIYRDDASGVVFFENSTVNPIPTNVLVPTEIADEADRINIVRTDKFKKNTGEYRTVFRRLNFTRIQDRDGNTFSTRTDALNYLIAQFAQAAPVDVNASYLGVWQATNNNPDITSLTPTNGDWFYVTETGSIDPNGDGLTTGSDAFKIDDIVKYCSASNFTGWQHIPNETVRVDELDSTLNGIVTNSSLTQYDIHVDPDYIGTVFLGTAVHPYTSIETAVSTSSANDRILVKGVNVISSEIVLPHSLHFYGTQGAEIKYSAYSVSNGDVMSFSGTDFSQEFTFKNLTIKNAGAYGLYTTKTLKVTIEDCTFKNNGWSGDGLSTITAESGFTLGYDSSNTDLQAFYASANASNGGAMRIQESPQILIVGNTVTNNLRGIRVQDCGVGGGGFITRNQSTQNIESGIYLAAGSTYYGCQNITVTVNVSAYNANNGLLIIGGLNNKFSQNEVNGNWNAGFCAWGAANSTLRDCGLYDNNRSVYNGIGNTGDAKASIQINEAYNLLGTSISLNPAARFIAEILDTQVHYTGLGSNTEKIGFIITSAVGALADNAKNIIKVDDVGFIGQDYAIDFSEVDLTNLRVSLGDNSYQSIGLGAVKSPLAGNYSELPFSNHIMEMPEVDVVVDTIKQTISLKEGVGGNTINVYAINELQSVLKTNSVDIIQKSSDKIQLRDLTLGNVYINGVVAGSNVNTMNDSLNAAFGMDLVEYKEFIETEVGVEGDGDSSTFYYIESPDGTYHYPLFKTEAEANQVDTDLGGSGTSHTHTYADDLTNTTWYMPDVSNHMSSSVMPVNGLYTAPNGETIPNVIWNIQTTDDDANYLPTFNSITYNVQEGSAINVQYKAAGMTDTFNLTNVPAGYADNGFAIIGTAEDITNGYGSAVTHTINVTKANAFGSVQGTITINVLANLAGNEFTIVEQSNGIRFTQDAGSTTLDFNTITFNAGSTYKFYLDGPTVEANDTLMVVDTNGNAYTTGVTLNGTPGSAGAYLEFVVPADVPPVSLVWTDGDGAATVTVPMTVAGSTYSVTVTGIALEGPSANQTGTNLFDAGDHGWLSIDEPLGAGQRLVLSGAFLSDVADAMGDNTIISIGLKDGAWANTISAAVPSGFEGGMRISIYRASATNFQLYGYNGDTSSITTVLSGGTLYNPSQFLNYNAFIELTSSGNNVRVGYALTSTHDANTVTYSDWSSTTKIQSGDQGYGISNVDVMVQGFAVSGNESIDADDIDWTALTEISVPTAPTMETNWTKAVDFSGGNEHLITTNTNSGVTALSMYGRSNTVPGPSTPGYTTNSSFGQPWATTIVFKADRNSSNQHIWNHGEGAGSTDDNIYLRLDANGWVYFGWGRGSSNNECRFLPIAFSSRSRYFGVYIAHNGTRLSSSNATASNLADAFDIRVMTNNGNDNFATLGTNQSTSSNWISTGNRMDRQVSGGLTIGGRGSNRNFHGEVASMVVTTLIKNVPMPTDAEIRKMITDPSGWLTDYKIGQDYGPYNGGAFPSTNFQLGNLNTGFATQVWLMGDGTNDSFSNGIRNQVYSTEQNYVKLQFNNMQSNDIVNTPYLGLS